MATPFDRLIQTVLPHLPGAIESAVKLELYGTCLEFFKWSTAWREEITFTIQAAEKEGDLTPTAGRVQNLIAVYGDDERPIYGAILPTPDTIRLRFSPDTDTIYTALCSITVTDPITNTGVPIVPYQIVERYMEELEHGLLARMMSQPKKPYTDTVMARFYMQRFRSGASRAQNEVKSGYTEGSQVWAFPQAFKTTR